LSKQTILPHSFPLANHLGSHTQIFDTSSDPLLKPSTWIPTSMVATASEVVVPLLPQLQEDLISTSNFKVCGNQMPFLGTFTSQLIRDGYCLPSWSKALGLLR
jgi:hypothetical protein